MMASQKSFVKPIGKKLKPLFPIQYENPKELNTSQTRSVIKVIEKKYGDKRFIKNWRLISLLNFDSKLISKSLANRLQDVMPNLVSENQSAYVNNRFTSKS